MKWSKKVTQHSHALDLEPGIFKSRDPTTIAASLKRSAETSQRRKGTPLQAAMSMLNFYINRPNKTRSCALACCRIAFCSVERCLPARLMSKFSIDIAACKGVPLRRWLVSAERFREAAIVVGSRDLKIPGSRSSAWLCCVTFFDHFISLQSILFSLAQFHTTQ